MYATGEIQGIGAVSGQGVWKESLRQSSQADNKVTTSKPTARSHSAILSRSRRTAWSGAGEEDDPGSCSAAVSIREQADRSSPGGMGAGEVLAD
jgi:hypothetical protein